METPALSKGGRQLEGSAKWMGWSGNPQFYSFIKTRKPLPPVGGNGFRVFMG